MVQPAVSSEVGDAAPEDVVCLGCGYDLRGLPAESRCPECGLTIESEVAIAGRMCQMAQAMDHFARAWLLSLLPGFGLLIRLLPQVKGTLILREHLGKHSVAGETVRRLWIASMLNSLAILVATLAVLFEAHSMLAPLLFVMLLGEALLAWFMLDVASRLAGWMHHEALRPSIRGTRVVATIFWLNAMFFVALSVKSDLLLFLAWPPAAIAWVMMALVANDVAREVRRFGGSPSPL